MAYVPGYAACDVQHALYQSDMVNVYSETLTEELEWEQCFNMHWVERRSNPYL